MRIFFWSNDFSWAQQCFVERKGIMRAMNNRVDPQVESLRVPPHSIEAELSVLGGLLLDNAAWDRITDFVHQDDFYRYDHRTIFQLIVKLINNSRPADVITVFESLSSAGKAEEVGGLPYLNALALFLLSVVFFRC